MVARLRPVTPLLAASVVCFTFAHSVFVSAGDKIPAELLVKDALASPPQTAVIEARLLPLAGRAKTAVVGAPLELVQDGRVLATATTNESGLATLRYNPTRKGNMPFTVRIAETSSLSASAAVTVAAWERRTPLLLVEMASLADPSTGDPLADAADELAKLTQFYYNVMYVTADISPQPDGFRASDRSRQWLATHKFPVGYVLVLPSTAEALGAKLDELRSAGWTTIRIGIGRSKEFADTFLQRRLEAVMVPEPAKGHAPKKAKVAKDWKEVRKKL